MHFNQVAKRNTLFVILIAIVLSASLAWLFHKAQNPFTSPVPSSSQVLPEPSPTSQFSDVDANNGRTADGKATRKEETEADLEKYGKLEPALYDRLQTLDDAEKIEVSIWLTPIDVEQIRAQAATRSPNVELEGWRPGKDADLERYKALDAEMKTAEKLAYQEREAPVITFLQSQGFEVSYASQSAPLLLAELPKSMILELEKRNDVEIIYLSRQYEPMSGTAVPSSPGF